MSIGPLHTNSGAVASLRRRHWRVRSGPSTLPRSHSISQVGGVLVDRNGLEVLARSECLHLLASATLGRIGCTSGALPVVLPVNFRLVGDEVVFRTGVGTKLDAATRNAVVAFEVDDFDPLSHEGWSVMVTGKSREVTDPDELAALAAKAIPRWAPRSDGRVVAVSTEMVSGRRIAHRAV